MVFGFEEHVSGRMERLLVEQCSLLVSLELGKLL